MEEQEKKNFDDLKFVRIDKPDLFGLIPRELFEQVKDHTFNTDKIYQLAHTFISNPLTRFYVLVNGDAKIKGILWAYVNLLNERIQVNLLSIDKEYQFGSALEKTLEFVKSWQSENGNLKIEIMTARPHAYEKFGLIKSKQVIMETQS